MTASGCVWSTCGGRHERVQQRLDRRPRLVGADGAAHEVVDHRRVVHLLPLAQRQHVVEAEDGEAARRDRREVGAGALDPERAELAAGVVDERPFADVLPPPMFASARSEPSRFER